MNAKTAAKPATGTYYSRNGLTVATVPLTAEESETLDRAAKLARQSKGAFILSSALAAAAPLIETQAAKELAAAKRAKKKSS